jgi:DNA-directed RNA polymerase III subunit RPC7
VNGTSTNHEKVIASHFINFQTLIKDGPFYTGSKLDLDNNTRSRDEVEHIDGINDNLKRYSDRYLKKIKIGPSIDDHPYAIEFFPQELYKVMGVDEKKKKKLLNISKLRNSKELLQSLDSTEIAKSMSEKLQNIADDENDGTDGNSKEAEVPEFEDNDDEFDDEDDDDDYNAEKYFDDGEDLGDIDDYDDEAAF